MPVKPYGISLGALPDEHISRSSSLRVRLSVITVLNPHLMRFALIWNNLS